MTKLVAIGFLGIKTVYINIDREKAIERYNSENPSYTVDEGDLSVDEYDVEDSFGAYDIWDE